MPHVETRKSTSGMVESEPESFCAAIVRRIAFWRKPEMDMDSLFTQAVNELHPQWERKRELKRTSHV